MEAQNINNYKKRFSSINTSNQSFKQVISKIIKFINEAPEYHYKLSIGSDSQSRMNKSLLVTAIHVHRIGKGAIGFITNQKINRNFNSLREKIYRETIATLELANMFTAEVMQALLTPFITSIKGDINFEFHLDIGKKGATRSLISEMISIVKATPFKPTIKPDSYTASAYANKHTKGNYKAPKLEFKRSKHN
ncbi:ribonuclease H-like YkuK family protein [Clostridium sp. 'deep sea']|uniref:ribonuclease H-like YkuK family protein n=1 Tax=Clostridium sp. 'deep sea' TaxID=2779445 RepID=UPI00189692C1|nr:ribonuclease H-like YkuK family protein [Clostridium sp. 'deep sea']QOR33963.1 ribonuclease H-like YkuK family protein [Clostridium sp. 'deep sea']